MAAVSGLLGLKKSVGFEEHEWGSAKVLKDLDLKKLSRTQLRNHLEARNCEAKGGKKQMTQVLEDSLEEERLRAIAHTQAIESEFQMNRALEERGSVYAVGTGSSGQLGQGDTEPREVFTVIMKTRDLGVSLVSVGYDMVLAVTEDKEVYTWGGMGVGPTGIAVSAEESKADFLKIKSEAEFKNDGEADKFMEPRVIPVLQGEETIEVGIGASHAVSVTAGGDCFVWGQNTVGQLGLGNFERNDTPEILPGIQNNLPVVHIAVGENHNLAIVKSVEQDVQRVYTWGHVADGRLGVGTRERIGAPKDKKEFFHAPTLIDELVYEYALEVACGPSHCMVRTKNAIFSWGHGGGGRLGHGDQNDRYKPAVIEALQDMVCLGISCGTWHSAAIIMVAPLNACGEVWTWGSGYHGQLGQGVSNRSLSPGRVKEISDWHIYAKSISCGSHHNAMVDHSGELWTWGSNTNNCLGHSIEEREVSYTPVPGHCGGFGALVDRIGRGMARSVACGKEYTIVATYPYEGPTEAIAYELNEEAALRKEEEKLQAAQERHDQETKDRAGERSRRRGNIAVTDESREETKKGSTESILDKNMGTQKH
uniref:RCC1-like domain-containing protein n=1 Tax=Octactis speculum TaxID=3111310 RepID=A0A7S2DQJ6_9STRA|mmetsp:Transcript_52422/g.71567  ORF Transcript_52422/g.71567 Transcript_52422/m.71567 type:complete len:593 (+) Transcript_52422:112-1890(+)